MNDIQGLGELKTTGIGEGLDDSVRSNIIAQLQVALASIYTTYITVKGFHWNYMSCNFISLHKLTDKLADELIDSADVIAERIRYLGGTSLADLTKYVELSPTAEQNSSPQITDVLLPMGNLISAIRSTINFIDECKDFSTSDDLIKLLKTLEKFDWQLRSHIQQ